MPEDPSSFDEVQQLLRSGRKIQAIKFVREESGLGLKEAKEQVDAVEAQMIANGELPPKTKGCAGVFLLLSLGLGAIGAWLVN